MRASVVYETSWPALVDDGQRDAHVGRQVLGAAGVQRAPVVDPLFHLVVVVGELHARDVRAQDVGLAGQVGGRLGLQPARLAAHQVQDAPVIRVALAEIRDQRRVPFGQPRPQPLVREARELQLVDVAVRRPDQERPPVAERRVLGARQVRHLDLARHAGQRDPHRVRPLLRRLDGLLVRHRLAERAPHQRRHEAEDRQREHDLDQREARRSRRHVLNLRRISAPAP